MATDVKLTTSNNSPTSNSNSNRTKLTSSTSTLLPSNSGSNNNDFEDVGSLLYRPVQQDILMHNNSTYWMNCMFEKQEESGNASFYEIISPIHSSSLPITDHVAVFPDEGLAFLEAARMVDRDNKESLATLLELGEEIGCSSVIVCIPQNANVKSIIGSYLSVGFTMVNNHPRDPSMPPTGNHFMMNNDQDSQLFLPGYTLLRYTF